MQPKLMSNDVVDAIIEKVNIHCNKHQIRRFEFIFHGGEPLLAGRTFYESFIFKAKKVLEPKTKLFFSLQTNGTLLDADWCILLKKLDIRLGISLDGPQKINDKLRVDHSGKGSYETAVRGIKSAQNVGTEFSILCVIDISSNPLEVYDHFKSLLIKRINFLLPYASHDRPPSGYEIDKNSTLYADWLIAVFDRWFYEERPKPRIRIFEELIKLILGFGSGYEIAGNRNIELLVVETDGSIEATGALKVCDAGITKEGLNILYNKLEEALDTSLIRQYHLSHQQLSVQCKACELKSICGGGHLPHRYRKANGFNNVSLFCQDMTKIIRHIQKSLSNLLPKTMADLLEKVAPKQ